jgi:hypothetical protein
VKERARAFATMLIVTAVVELVIMRRLTSPLRPLPAARKVTRIGCHAVTFRLKKGIEFHSSRTARARTRPGTKRTPSPTHPPAKGAVWGHAWACPGPRQGGAPP